MEQATKVNSLYTLTESELSKALKPYYKDVMNSLSPDLGLTMDYDHVVRQAYQNLQEHANAPIYLQSQEIINSFTTEEIENFTTGDLVVASLTAKCTTSTFTVIADVLGLVLTLVGVSSTVTKNATRRLLSELGPKVLNGFLSKIRDIAHAGSFFEKVKEMVSLMMQVKNALGVSAFISAVKKEVSIIQIVAIALTMVAQFTIWFASDGIALVGELALGSVAVYQLVSDSLECVRSCSIT